MSFRGVPQLRQLILRYSDYDGSSRGIREFIATQLVNIARAHPTVTVKTELKRCRHPFIRAEYVRGEPKVIGVKNKTAMEVNDVVTYLKNTTGRKIKKLDKPVVSRNQSIQGMWSPDLPMTRFEFKLQHST